ncbi:MAG: hypothetical protein M0042_04615 [Nitrospiraceae bacterium]|nr:hypothetical protein [Nitrospiraceae bacterium]
MKRIVTLFAGIVVLIAAAAAIYAGPRTAASTYSSDKMITNDDLEKIKPDQEHSTLNQMPSAPEGSQGSAAGGVSSEPGTVKEQNSREKGSLETKPAGPEENQRDRETNQPETYSPSY